MLGTIGALLVFPAFSLAEAALLAAILAPTDVALGQAVLNHPFVPVRIRQALNVEGGLNDGLTLPLVLILLSLSAPAEALEPQSFWVDFIARQLIFGPLIGLGVGVIGGRAVSRATQSKWMNLSFQQLSSIALAILAFSTAEWIGGNGLLAAFFAGLAIGNLARPICTCLYEFAEAEGQLLALLTFSVFGAAMLPLALPEALPGGIVYAGLSLGGVRVLATALSLIGTRLRPASVLFLGWFDPRGIASVLFGLLALEASSILNGEMVFSVTVLTVALSVFAHGLTASLGARLYAEHTDAMKPDETTPEMEPVTELPVRLPFST